MFPSSVEEGMPRPKAMAGVVRPARVPTTPRWLWPREGFSSLHPLLVPQGAEPFLVLMSSRSQPQSLGETSKALNLAGSPVRLPPMT